MAEQVIDTAVVTTVRAWDIDALAIEFTPPSITVTLRADDGVLAVRKEVGDTALQFIRAINKADLRVNTLRRRILARLFPAGEPTGTPD